MTARPSPPRRSITAGFMDGPPSGRRRPSKGGGFALSPLGVEWPRPDCHAVPRLIAALRSAPQRAALRKLPWLAVLGSEGPRTAAGRRRSVLGAQTARASARALRPCLLDSGSGVADTNSPSCLWGTRRRRSSGSSSIKVWLLVSGGPAPASACPARRRPLAKWSPARRVTGADQGEFLI